jgi:PBP1b-binding outer membrane lipoprotein LpoB
MEQKTKLSILILLLVVFIVGSVYLIQNKKDTPAAQTTPITLPPNQKLSGITNVNTNLESTREISGKIRSINEKAVYIELADGKGFAANINPKTPVFTQGVDKTGTLIDLKAGQDVTVKAGNTGDAIQILINK